MKLFNTLSQAKEEFQPENNTVKIYVCGVTPDDPTHLGHAFTFVTFDTLIRFLKYKGYSVTYVQNVTDIDDPLFARAKQNGVPWNVLAEQRTAEHLASMDTLNVARPDFYIKATESVPDMIPIIQRLLDGGYAYISEGSVYCSIQNTDSYRPFAHVLGLNTYEDMLKLANERGNIPNDPKKHDPLDFALWQAAVPELPSWPSPWGLGRPGWHIECSAMSTRYLGATFDIHGGGADLIFPHHAFETTQSECANHVHPFVKVWMHTAMVRMSGEKMSKSLGNVIHVRDLLSEHSADAVRLLVLSHHYREAWEFEKLQMAAYDDAAAKLARIVKQDINADAVNNMEESEILRICRTKCIAALEDDLNVPDAITELLQFSGYLLNTGNVTLGAKALVKDLGAILGLSFK